MILTRLVIAAFVAAASMTAAAQNLDAARAQLGDLFGTGDKTDQEPES